MSENDPKIPIDLSEQLAQMQATIIQTLGEQIKSITDIFLSYRSQVNVSELHFQGYSTLPCSAHREGQTNKLCG